jgi:hypothetical protein
MATTGLTPESVETTMDNLAESLADYRDVEDAIIDGQKAVLVDMDDEEVEQELEALLASERGAKEKDVEALGAMEYESESHEVLESRFPPLPNTAESLEMEMARLSVEPKANSSKERPNAEPQPSM